jgi:hypothetical protein
VLGAYLAQVDAGIKDAKGGVYMCQVSPNLSGPRFKSLSLTKQLGALRSQAADDKGIAHNI